MDLTPSPEDLAFRNRVRRWLEANVPEDDLKTLDARKAWHRRLYEAGYVGMLWPPEYGGRAATPMRGASVQSEEGPAGRPPPIHGPALGFICPAITGRPAHST